MTTRLLLENGRIHTQASGLVVDSMAISRNRIVAVGSKLRHDPDFRRFPVFDLRGRMVTPGLVDAHTHFYYWAINAERVRLDDCTSLDQCLRRIGDAAGALGPRAWVLGEGYSVEKFRPRRDPDRLVLDAVTGGRPAFIFSKDEHSAWVNSRALQLAGITAKTKQPDGGRIEHFDDGTPSGVLREGPGYLAVHGLIPTRTAREIDRLFLLALDRAYQKGVTGVHSFDGWEGFEYFRQRTESGKLGLRIEYYPQAAYLSQLEKQRIRYGHGDAFLRVAGVKIFADGALGSRSALCFNRYPDSRDNFGIEVTGRDQIARFARRAARLGLPIAVHAIGDRAAANVLDAIEEVGSPLGNGARHRIEHLQLVRRKDVARMKRLGVIASMQPSHCVADIDMVNTLWKARSADAYVFRTLLERGVDLAFGSDVPIEPLDPLTGIENAVRRVKPGGRTPFHAEQRLTAAQALHGFTAGAARAAGVDAVSGYLLPGHPADFTVLGADLTRVPAGKIAATPIVATVLDGRQVYGDPSCIF